MKEVGNNSRSFEETGLTAKQAWWAGARAALGLHADIPRTVVASRLADSSGLDQPDGSKPAGKGEG